MALSGHANDAEQCLLSGAKQTWLKDGVMSAYDPKRTMAGSKFRSAPKPGCERGFPCRCNPIRQRSRILSVSTIATPRGGWVEPRWEQ